MRESNKNKEIKIFSYPGNLLIAHTKEKETDGLLRVKFTSLGRIFIYELEKTWKDEVKMETALVTINNKFVTLTIPDYWSLALIQFMDGIQVFKWLEKHGEEQQLAEKNALQIYKQKQNTKEIKKALRNRK